VRDAANSANSLADQLFASRLHGHAVLVEGGIRACRAIAVVPVPQFSLISRLTLSHCVVSGNLAEADVTNGNGYLMLAYSYGGGL
jgi:hypothetical protein